MVEKADFNDKLKNLNITITSNKTKPVLVDSELKNYKHMIQVFLMVKVIFFNDGSQNFLISQSISNTFTFSGLTDTILR